MYQQYIYQAQSAIAYLSTDELKELINDDEKLEERVMDVVSVPLCILSVSLMLLTFRCLFLFLVLQYI